MSVQLKVPSIVCEGCADTITKAIVALDAEAKVEVDLSTKMVSIEGKASETAIKDAIAAVGHTVE
jgi:copper chaperone